MNYFFLAGWMVFLLQASSAAASAAALPAFPRAEGYGALAAGGRGGAIIAVTNLNDTGPGSLRSCVTAAGPRTCVFGVAGTIVLHSSLEVTSPYLTIAGQTAPGGGITLRTGPDNNHGLLVIRDSAHDTIIRYLRSRPGPGGSNGDTLDAITINAANVILDHVSASWGVDENVNTWYPTAHDISIQWSIISEGLDQSIHPQGAHSKGLLMGGGNTNISAHHLLFAHNMDRHPEMKGDPAGVLEAINNLIYNWGWRSLLVSDEYGPARVNIIGNYFQSGLNDPRDQHEIEYYRAGGQGVRLYVKGNIGPHRPTDINRQFQRTNGGEWAVVSAGTPDTYLSTAAFPGATIPVTVDTASAAYEAVLNDAGAGKRLDCNGNWVNNRDAVDARIVADVKNGTGGIIDHPDQVGGWPILDPGTRCADVDNDGMADPWEQRWFGTLSRGSMTNSSGDADADGYTDLEEFFNGTDPTGAAPPLTTTPATASPTSAGPTATLTPLPPSLPVSPTSPPSGFCDKAHPSQFACYGIWYAAYYTGAGTADADFSADGRVSLADFETWRRLFIDANQP